MALGAHIERAHALARPARRWNRGLRSRIGRTVDTTAFGAMKRAFLGGAEQSVAVSPQPQQAWQPYQHQAATDPLRFFPRPNVPAVVSQVVSRLLAGAIVDLSFPSYHAPERQCAMDLVRRFPHNGKTHVRHFRHDRPEHPAVVCLHGWGGGNYRIEASLFRARRLYELGLDVYLYIQPYHGPRSPQPARFGRVMHPSADIVQTNEAFLQSVWDVRAIMRYHTTHAGGPVGVMGASLGGYVTALLASVAPETAFAIPLLPIADFSALLWSSSAAARPEKGRIAPPADPFASLCRAMAVHSPLAHRLAIPRERLLLIAGRDDHISPPSHAAALWEHWGEPEIHWFPGSHLLHFGRPAYLQQVEHLLRTLALLR